MFKVYGRGRDLVNLFSEHVQNSPRRAPHTTHTRRSMKRAKNALDKTIFVVTFVMFRVFVVSSWRAMCRRS
jgi:hypothetical protein